MIRCKLIIILLILALLLSSCSYSVFRFPVIAPIGGMVNFTRAPIDITFKNTNVGSKVGTASTYQIWFVSFGDASVGTAAKNGGIKTVNHIDYRFINVLVFFLKYTTIVYGE